ncbi:MAG: WYL domain-containing protein [Paracoccus sp. (in: a-proteobacteria)]|uniref:WYL domain-containing protein n=1 Tax=Paracoccus sp. TaxID=267 RepID=UPI0026DF0613|nr:WYL domain-containing protein [Paracoccus sp. (in: a-proteobacteria)]MDO5611970.1 WYL domain-containing protein [Paracoccus sp. (in: a-proteobacteria)]
MRPRGDMPHTVSLTRRALASRLAGVAAAIGIGGHGLSPVQAAAPALDPDLRDAALRGLALADHRGDPVNAAAARAAMQRLVETDPEGALLLRLYRKLDVRPAAYWQDQQLDLPDAAPHHLGALHRAIRDHAPIRFGYTDLQGKETERAVLPLALVHPPQGVKLLAWCSEAGDYRQFFVRAMQGLTILPGNFSDDRMELLQGLVHKEGA